MNRKSDAFTNNTGYKKLSVGRKKLKQYDYPKSMNSSNSPDNTLVSQLPLPNEIDPAMNRVTRI